MNEYGQPPVSSPPGYISDQGRKSFTLIAGLLGAGAFIAQFAIPFVAMFVIMSSFLFSPLKISELDKGAHWRDAYWFVEVSRSAFEPESRGTDSKCLTDRGRNVQLHGGIFIVALTENWQRIGVLAARTIVVNAPRSGAVELHDHRQLVK